MSTDDVAIEKRNRMRLALAAYAYEFEDDSIMSDQEFDALAKAIRPDVRTGNAEMDNFFATEFNPCTGQWVHVHLGLKRLRELYNTIYRKDRAV